MLRFVVVGHIHLELLVGTVHTAHVDRLFGEDSPFPASVRAQWFVSCQHRPVYCPGELGSLQGRGLRLDMASDQGPRTLPGQGVSEHSPIFSHTCFMCTAFWRSTQRMQTPLLSSSLGGKIRSWPLSTDCPRVWLVRPTLPWALGGLPWASHSSRNISLFSQSVVTPAKPPSSSLVSGIRRMQDSDVRGPALASESMCGVNQDGELYVTRSPKYIKIYLRQEKSSLQTHTQKAHETPSLSWRAL